LVPSTVAHAPSITPRDAPDAFRIPAGSDWRGYFGAPRYATPDIGRRVFEGDIEWLVSNAFQLLDGQADERTMGRIAALMDNPNVATALALSMQRDAAMAKRQQDWIAAQR
jgi:hypothetical protein